MSKAFIDKTRVIKIKKNDIQPKPSPITSVFTPVFTNVNDVSSVLLAQASPPSPSPIIRNKGTGAGGANTNYHGKKFEEKTNNYYRLIQLGYTKILFGKTNKTYDHYLEQSRENQTTVFVLQNGLKIYMKQKYNIDLFRCPDEAYIIEYNGKKIVKILEKKEQNVEGSVETKLWSGPSLKREYELVLGEEFEVHYAFCVSDFLKKKLVSDDKKYTILQTIFRENKIAILYGDDENYFDTLDQWIHCEHAS